MTNALKIVFEKISGLPASQQNSIAKMLSAELKWQKSFAESQQHLGNMAAEALSEYKEGKTKELNLK